MSKRSTGLLIDDIIEAIEKIERYLQNVSKNEFFEDEKTIDAVVRNLEVIGEASNRLSEEFRMDHNSIEWRKIIGLRNRIVHEYFGIDTEIVWQIVHVNLPHLKNQLQKMT